MLDRLAILKNDRTCVSKSMEYDGMANIRNRCRSSHHTSWGRPPNLSPAIGFPNKPDFLNSLTVDLFDD